MQFEGCTTWLLRRNFRRFAPKKPIHLTANRPLCCDDAVMGETGAVANYCWRKCTTKDADRQMQTKGPD